MIKTAIANGAIYEVETLPNGKMGRLSIAIDPTPERRIAIEDGLIVRDPFAPGDAAEYRGILTKGNADIVFTIVCANRGQIFAGRIAKLDPIVKALIDAGWVLWSVSHVSGGEEF